MKRNVVGFALFVVFVTLRPIASCQTPNTYSDTDRSDEKSPFARVTEAPIKETTFVATKAGVYMVRAVKLETGPSGSYFNASQGLFAP